MELISLIGDIDENFYQLGLRDKEAGKLVHSDVKMMLRTPWKNINTVLEEIGKALLKNSLLKKTDQYRHLKSYAEGLGITVEECAYVMIIPELVSAMSKWAPGFIKGQLGCSSFITRNDKSEIIHGRILDFPLQGSFDLYERAISYDLNKMPRTLGFSSAGIPYPSITFMTEHGFTLALHQKFTNHFNTKGLSIFEFIFKLLANVNDKASLIKFIKSNQTITTWCLYCTFSNGDIIAADCFGENSFINEYQVPDKGILYFCNHLEDKSLNQQQFLPLGFHQYNLMREENAQKKIEHIIKKNKHPLSDLELLQMMSTPLKQNHELKNFKNFKLDNLTPSSITVLTMNPTSQNAYYINGKAPKTFRNDLSLIEQAFQRPKLTDVKPKKSLAVDQEYFLGLEALMNAQKGFDLKDPQIIYHQLQMAVDHLELFPEKHLAEFYFLIAQYLYEKHPQILGHLLDEFKKFEGHLPEYLNDHCLLFIGRLEIILNFPPTLEEDKIKTIKLRDIYERESKIPKAIFHSTTKNFIIPRIDILDVVYLLTT